MISADNECVDCSLGTYSPDGTLCLECPDGAICPPATDLPLISDGFFRADVPGADKCDESLKREWDVGTCPVGTALEYDSSECVPISMSGNAIYECHTEKRLYECPGGASACTLGNCTVGHVGVLCDTCEVG